MVTIFMGVYTKFAQTLNFDIFQSMENQIGLVRSGNGMEESV